MPSYLANAVSADGADKLIKSLEFDAPDSLVARQRTDAWAGSELPAGAEVTVRLFAGRALLFERDQTGAWHDVPRPPVA